MGYKRREKYKAAFLASESESIHIDFYGTTAVYAAARCIPERGEIMCKDGADKSTQEKWKLITGTMFQVNTADNLRKP